MVDVMRMLLLMSFGGSLRRWHDQGILRRELELYLRHLQDGFVEKLFIFSYDHDDTVPFAGLPADVRNRIVLIRPRKRLRSRLSKLIYSLSPLRAAEIARQGIQVVKTNQV